MDLSEQLKTERDTLLCAANSLKGELENLNAPVDDERFLLCSAIAKKIYDI
jgi:hypothetical protein